MIQIESSDACTATYGGYLFIRKAGEALKTISVPSLMLNPHEQKFSSENLENFTDQEGNLYSVFVQAFVHGVYWKLKIESLNDEHTLASHIEMEFQANDN